MANTLGFGGNRAERSLTRCSRWNRAPVMFSKNSKGAGHRRSFKRWLR